MGDGAHRSGDDRILLLAPTGRDAPLTCALLQRAGIGCLACSSIEELCERYHVEGAAAFLIAEEVLVRPAFQRLCTVLAAQESWSDLPVLLFTATSSTLRSRDPGTKVLEPLGNVTLLERPVLPITMLSAANAALRARRRQYAARAELNAQQLAVRQRDQFLAMLGHELRNPLAAISLAHKLESGAGAARHHAVIGRQVAHLTRLVDDLLDVARVTSGKITLQRRSLDLAQLAESCSESLRPSLEVQQLTLTLERPPLPVPVLADPVRMEQVVTNLLTNAAKYTPAHGRIELRVRVDGEEALLEVADTGVGIAPEMLERVFDLFAQAEGSLDRAKGGLGIGLTLVRNVIELHGGHVDAASAGLGHGSRFSIRLPLSREPLVAASVLPNESAEPAPQRRVLVVEDNEDSRELLVQLIGRLGYEVYMAEDGPSGVRVTLEKRPDVVLVDIGLPGLDGYGVARKVRAELGQEPCLIALTGYGQPEDRQHALEAGFDAHFTKPLDMRAIDALLRKGKQRHGATG